MAINDVNDTVDWAVANTQTVDYMALDEAGSSLYVLTRPSVSYWPSNYTLQRRDMHNGALLETASVIRSSFSVSGGTISPDGEAMSVYWADQIRGVLHWQRERVSYFNVGRHPTVYFATCMATLDGSAIYLAGNNEVVQLNSSGQAVLRRDVPAPPFDAVPRDMAVSADGRLFMTLQLNGSLLMYSAALQLLKSIDVGRFSNPYRLAVTADGSQVYVLMSGQPFVTQLDVTTGTLGRRLMTIGSYGPNDVAVDWTDDSV